jgi:glycerol-3-phosphate acyltransferase PlsY
MTDAALVLGAYLLGSISWSYLVVHALTRSDVRTVGSGNAGATNVLRAAGRGPAILVLVLDIAKGAAAVLTVRALGAPPPVVGAAAAAVVLGHVYPVFLRFRGGKGVATTAGALGSLAPLPALLSLGVFVGVVAWKRYVSLGSIVAVASFPILVLVAGRLAWIAPPSPWMVGCAVGIAALVVAKHASNLRRLRAGTELRLGERREAAA